MTAEQKYQDLSKEFEEFVYIVSHDLRAPLRQIDAFMKLFLENLEVDLDEDQIMFRDMMQECIQDADKVLNILLEYSRIKPNPDTFEICGVQDIYVHSQGMLPEGALSSDVSITCEDVNFDIFADKDFASRALFYILDNAIKFRAPDAPVRISISAMQRDDQTVITVQDDGIGMPPEKIEHAVTILRQLNPKQDYDGNGTGLAYAQKIMRLHDGDLKITSELDKGTSVSLIFPDKTR